MIHYLIIDSSTFGEHIVYDFDDPIVFNKACWSYKQIEFIYDSIDLLNSKLPTFACIILEDDDFQVFNRQIDDDSDYRLFYCHDLDLFKRLSDEN